MALLQKAYLGATPLFRNTSWFEGTTGKPINASSVVTVTADNTAHVKGGWQELIASTSADASYVVIDAGGVFTSGADTATLLDLGTGSSTNETALISDVAIGSAARQANRASLCFGVPIKIASGTRLSARIQSVVSGGKTATIQVYTFNMGDYAAAPTSVDVIGTSTATSAGTAMSGSSGNWVQIKDSTTRAYRGVVVVPSASSASLGDIIIEYKLGTGASLAEVEVGRAFAHYSNVETAGNGVTLLPVLAQNIPSGTRLSIQHNIASSPGSYDVTLIGIP
jgi:hypothetical protein